MVSFSNNGLPDEGEELATEFLLLCIAAGHYAFGSRKDGNSEARHNTGDIAGADVMTATWTRNALEVSQHRTTIHVAWLDLDFGDTAFLDFEIPDVAFLLEDLGDVSLYPGVWHEKIFLAGTSGVFETREEVRDGISENCHGSECVEDSRGWVRSGGGGLSFVGLLEVAERHAEFGEERTALVVGIGSRDKDQVKADLALDLIEFDFRKDRLVRNS